MKVPLSPNQPKAIGRNEMPFGNDCHVVPSNIVLNRGPGLPKERRDLGSEHPVHSHATYCQITLAVVSSVATDDLQYHLHRTSSVDFLCSFSENAKNQQKMIFLWF